VAERIHLTFISRTISNSFITTKRDFSILHYHWFSFSFISQLLAQDFKRRDVLSDTQATGSKYWR